MKTKNKNSSANLARYDQISQEEVVDVVSDAVALNDGKRNFPKKKYRAGAISATVWENKGKTIEGKENSYNTISLERVYQDREGNWKSTNSFRINDLPKIQVLMQKAFGDLVLKEQELFKKQDQ